MKIVINRIVFPSSQPFIRKKYKLIDPWEVLSRIEDDCVV